MEDGLPMEQLSLRREREKRSLATFLTHTRKQWRNLGEMHQWMFHRHSAYSSRRHMGLPSADGLSPEVLATY